MALDHSSLGDHMAATAGYNRPTEDHSFVRGFGVAELFGPDGELKASIEFDNIITQTGETRYAEAGSGMGSPSVGAPTGMQLGTGTTTPGKTTVSSTSSAKVVTYTTGSARSFYTGVSSTITGDGRHQMTYVCNWPAGVATATGLSEVVIITQPVSTDSAADESKTISRALLAPVVNKGAADSLTITWNHVIGSVPQS